MSIPAVFYVPLLHCGLAPDYVPSQVSFFPSGLPLRADSQARAPHAGAQSGAIREEGRAAAAAALPFSPAEARAVLDEMLRLGDEHGPGGLLQRIAGQQALTGPFGPGEGRAERADELAALEAFTRTGQAPVLSASMRVRDWGASPAIPEAAAVREALVDCQKTLLLVHALEEQTRDLDRLRGRIRAAEDSLHSLLCDDEERLEGVLAAEKAAGSERVAEKAAGSERVAEKAVGSERVAGHGDADETRESATIGIPWRLVVDAVMPFLPEDALLFTADSAMALDLRDAGMLLPLPEDRADVCTGWSHELVNGLLYAHLPAWRLVGRRGPVSGRPWLERSVEVLAARPAGGWTGKA